MKNLFKQYLSLTSSEKLNRLRCLRKKLNNPDRSVRFVDDIICYHDLENCCLRELNGDIIVKVGEHRSREEKEKILGQISFYDDFINEGLINKEYNDMDYYYLCPSDFVCGFDIWDKKYYQEKLNILKNKKA